VKKTALAVLLLFYGAFAGAQTQPSDIPPYKRFPTIPPFKLLKVDSASFVTKDDIKKHHPTLIMCFSPECEHCKHQTEDLITAMDKFKDIEIVMATFQPLAELKEFYRYYRIADYPNIKIGRDDKYVLQPFYKFRSFPFLALYDKKGNLITTFEGNQKVDKLLKAFHGSAD
jgi:thiol-disulfide isomerase/thioredoxin